MLPTLLRQIQDVASRPAGLLTATILSGMQLRLHPLVQPLSSASNGMHSISMGVRTAQVLGRRMLGEQQSIIKQLQKLAGAVLCIRIRSGISPDPIKFQSCDNPAGPMSVNHVQGNILHWMGCIAWDCHA